MVHDSGGSGGGGAGGGRGRDQPCDYHLDIEVVENDGESGAVKSVEKERWLVCNQMGGGGASELASSEELAHMRLVRLRTAVVVNEIMIHYGNDLLLGGFLRCRAPSHH